MTANATPTLSLPPTPEGIDRLGQKAMANMRRYDNCTQSILAAFLETLDMEAPMLMRSAGAMFGGMASSLTCGIHTAGLMVLGLFMGRENIKQGLDGLFPIILPAQDLVHQLNLVMGSHSCRELTGIDFTDLNQAIRFRASEGHARCVARVGEGAKEIARFIQQLDTQGDLFRIDIKPFKRGYAPKEVV